MSEQPGVQPDAQPDAPPDAQPDAQPDVPAGADPRVAAAVERLDGLGEVPVAEHVEVYEDVHQVLQESLAEAQDDGADR